MTKYKRKDQDKKKVTDIKIFSVPFTVGEIKDNITSITTASALKKSSKREKSLDCKFSICISDEEGVFNFGLLICYLI